MNEVERAMTTMHLERGPAAAPTPGWNSRYVRYAESNGNTPEDQAFADERDWPGGRMTGFILWTGEAWQAWSALRGRKYDDPKGEADHRDFDAWLGRRAQYGRWRQRHKIVPVPDGQATTVIANYLAGDAGRPCDRALRVLQSRAAAAGFTCQHDGLAVYRRSTRGGWAHAEDAVRALSAETQPDGWPK